MKSLQKCVGLDRLENNTEYSLRQRLWIVESLFLGQADSHPFLCSNFLLVQLTKSNNDHEAHE